MISKEIDPGPASMGIASGVSETSVRVCTSACTLLFFIPLCFVKLPVSSANPEVAMINPPASRKELREIPKNASTYFPTKKAMRRIANTFTAVHNAVLSRWCFASSLVKATKMGTVPKGLITENKAEKMAIKSSIVFAAKFAVHSLFEVSRK